MTVATARRIKSVGRSQLKTRQLALLVHLDEERTLGRAAVAAGLTQPAASKLLRQVENALDVKLFERHARGMAPTCYGEILLRHARLVLSGLGLAREEITALKSGLSGKAAIGAVLSPGSHLVPMAIARVKQRYPGILLSIEIDPSRQLVQRLVQGHLDMVIGRVLESDRADELVYEPLAADEPHAVIAGAQHPLAGRDDLDLEDLIDQPWIVPPQGTLARDKLFGMFMQRGLFLPTNVVETLSFPAITALLQQGNYLVALPEHAVQSCCKAGILTVVLRNLPLGVGGFGLITRRHHPLSAGAQLLLNTVRELAKQIYPLEGYEAPGAALAHV
ncbi:MAG: LysR family transcriptional regulator [Steroidobacteraceae bacterium]